MNSLKVIGAILYDNSHIFKWKPAVLDKKIRYKSAVPTLYKGPMISIIIKLI